MKDLTEVREFPEVLEITFPLHDYDQIVISYHNAHVTYSLQIFDSGGYCHELFDVKTDYEGNIFFMGNGEDI